MDIMRIPHYPQFNIGAVFFCFVTGITIAQFGIVYLFFVIS